MGTEFAVLGPLQAVVGGAAVELGQPKQRALLAQLLLARGRVVAREVLVDGIWGEAPPASAAAAVQLYVHGLRRALGPDAIETHGTGYRLALEPGALDLERFEALVARGADALRDGAPGAAADALRAALALRRGPALADLAGQPLARAGAALDERVVEAFELLVEAELAAGRHEAVAPELEAAIAEHPYRERLRAHHALALYRAGRAADALDAIRAARWALDQLGLEPGPDLRELERAILRHDEGLRGTVEARPAARLPQPPTSLVGRAAELRAVLGLLDSSRLVTLTGPGGIGKTRLALAVAEQLPGAVFVDLSPLTDPNRIAAAIGERLGAAEGADPADLLAGQSLLLVLDNVEHVVDGAPAVAELLSVVPGLRVLATSRVPLRVAGEQELALEPLPVPPRTLPTFADLAANESVLLFVERARAIDPAFEVSAATVGRIAEICRAVDGVPLALELAAARTRVLSLDEIVARLGRALDLLAAGGRDRPVRQRTLRATLDWSYQLLSDGERRTFAALAVFSGGFTLDAVEAVAVDGNALDDLSALVEASLVRRSAGEGQRRFRMLETVRAYAAERLAESAAEEDARRRHARHFLARAQDVARRVDAPDGLDTMLDELDPEHDNYRAALITLAHDAANAYVELVLALQRFWLVRGHLTEARGHVDRALELAQEPRVRAAVLVRGAIIPSRQGDTARAKMLWEEALALFEELGDQDGTARCVAELAGVALYEGDVDTAAAGYGRARELFLGLGQRVRVGIVLANLAEIECMRGDLPAALAFAEEAVALQRELDDLDGIGISSINLARIHLQLGDPDEARRRLSDGLAAARRLEYVEVVGYGLAMGAELAWTVGDAPRAARLLGGVDAIFAAIGAELLGLDREGYDRTRAAVEAAFGGDFEAAYVEGRALEVDRLVSLATA